MLSTTTSLLALAASASARTLYVSSYTGAITTLNMTNPTNKTYQLAQVAVDNHSSPNASWLELDAKNNNLFSLDENIIGLNGSINSYKVDPATGLLKAVTRHATPAAPVNSALYTSPSGSQLLIVAHYAHALSTWRVDTSTGAFSQFETVNFTLAKPGPKADRQAASHPHQVVIDPSKQYAVVPDLGADAIRIFHIDPKTLRLKNRPSITVPPGSGPRHGRFCQQGNSTGNGTAHYHLVTELSNQLLSYKTTSLPKNGGLAMTPIGKGLLTYGDAGKKGAFAGNAASEIAISADKKSIYVSNRNATALMSANPDSKNKTQIPSDTMARFTIDAKSGVPKFAELSPAGGKYPRHFSLSPDGKLAAVGLQMSGTVAIFEVCPKTGMLGQKFVADFGGLGNVTSVVWGM